MGLLDALFGNVSEIPVAKAQQDFAAVLIKGEKLERAFVLVRDMLVFTNLRIITLDKQGLTGKRQNLRSIPYKSITMFTRESAGHLDWNAEIHIFVRGQSTAFTFRFSKGVDVNYVYQILSHFVLPAS